MKTPSRQELAQMSYEELGALAAELAEEDEEIKRVRHYFIEEFWQRTPDIAIKPDDLAEGKIMGSSFNGKPILWAKVKGEIYALGDKCPHRGFPLHHKGKLEDYTLTCAYHGGQFDIRTGTCIRHPTETFPCDRFQIREGDDGTILCAPAK